MTEPLSEVIARVVLRIVELAKADDALRADLHALAEKVLGATADTQAPAALTLGQADPEARRPSITLELSHTADEEDSLDGLEARLRDRARGARDAASRQSGFGAGLDLEDGPTDPGEPLHSQAAGCYEAVAEALGLVRSVSPASGEPFRKALHLLVEAQSALRIAVRAMQRPDDPDQRAAFELARDLAAQHQVFIRRYMRADEPADPSRWVELLDRIRSLASSLPGRKRPAASFEGLDETLARLKASPGAADLWSEVAQAVDALVRDGIPPSHRELRDRLLPLVDELPELGEAPAGFRHVLREIDAYLSTRPEPATHAELVPSAEVQLVARLLQGSAVVLIGGARRREAQKALERAFGLKSLVWVETKEHQALSTFEPVIARPEVRLVLLAIRWSSHAFGDVKVYCDRHDKALVRLPGGYNPNQVAAQVLAQCSDDLRG